MAGRGHRVAYFSSKKFEQELTFSWEDAEQTGSIFGANLRNACLTSACIPTSPFKKIKLSKGLRAA